MHACSTSAILSLPTMRSGTSPTPPPLHENDNPEAPCVLDTCFVKEDIKQTRENETGRHKFQDSHSDAYSAVDLLTKAEDMIGKGTKSDALGGRCLGGYRNIRNGGCSLSQGQPRKHLRIRLRYYWDSHAKGSPWHPAVRHAALASEHPCPWCHSSFVLRLPSPSQQLLCP